jgi:hypothetical protein
VGQIQDATAQVPVLADLAAATGKHLEDTSAAAGFLKTAETAAGAIELPQAKVAALAKVASAYGQTGGSGDAERVLTGALDYARSRGEPREQATCLAHVWSALVTLKRTDQAAAVLAEARQTAEGIAAAESRAYALLQLAQKCSAGGRKEIAAELLDKAQAAADQVSDSSARGPLVDDIARAREAL